MTPATPTGAGHPLLPSGRSLSWACVVNTARAAACMQASSHPSTVMCFEVCVYIVCEDEVRFNIKETQMIIIHGREITTKDDIIQI